MIYIALVVENNSIFDFVLKKIIGYYERLNMIESYQYEQLWKVWANDLSRNLMHFYAILFSFVASFLYFSLSKLLEKIKKCYKRKFI